jgi:hypothetical protein
MVTKSIFMIYVINIMRARFIAASWWLTLCALLVLIVAGCGTAPAENDGPTTSPTASDGEYPPDAAVTPPGAVQRLATLAVSEAAVTTRQFSVEIAGEIQAALPPGAAQWTNYVPSPQVGRTHTELVFISLEDNCVVSIIIPYDAEPGDYAIGDSYFANDNPSVTARVVTLDEVPARFDSIDGGVLTLHSTGAMISGDFTFTAVMSIPNLEETAPSIVVSGSFEGIPKLGD